MLANKTVRITGLGENDLYSMSEHALVGSVGRVDAFGLSPSVFSTGYLTGGITRVDNQEFYYFCAVQVDEVPDTTAPDNIVLGYN